MYLFKTANSKGMNNPTHEYAIHTNPPSNILMTGYSANCSIGRECLIIKNKLTSLKLRKCHVRIVIVLSHINRNIPWKSENGLFLMYRCINLHIEKHIHVLSIAVIVNGKKCVNVISVIEQGQYNTPIMIDVIPNNTVNLMSHSQ